MKPLIAVALLCLIATVADAQSPPWPPHDFAEYYSAARVIVDGGNPYDGAALLPIQRIVNENPTQREATMLWTPPWTLPLYAPLGLLPPATGQILWAALQALLCGVGSALTWRVYGRGLPAWSWAVAAAVVVSSAPIWWTFGYGQNTGFLVLGLGGYLHLKERNRPFAAGLLGALTAIKPHLLVVFAVKLLLDARTKPGRRVLCGGIVALAVGSAIALSLNHGIFTQFRDALTAPSSGTTTNVADWQLPLLSYHFRWAVEPTEFRWQFLPIVLVALGYAATRSLRAESVSAGLQNQTPALTLSARQEKELPRVVLLSVLAAPYGGWAFDLVVLLIVSLHGFASALKSQRLAAILVAVCGHLVILRYAALIGWLQEGLWLSPAVGLWWLLVTMLSKEKTG